MSNLYGLIGYPLGHSFSAAFFAEKFSREHVDARYENFEMPSVGKLRDFVRAHPQLRGFNVTIPHKQAVIPHLDALSEEAREIGAVNVVKVCRGRLGGYNTDVLGFVRSLEPLLPSESEGKVALVLGTGGASKAVCYGLRGLGYHPQFVSRTRRDSIISYADLTPALMAEAHLVVNCTPLGMYPHVDVAPDIPYHLLTPRHILYDLVYNPPETEFLRRGREHGTITKNGLEMLHLQAEAAWEIWNAPARA